MRWRTDLQTALHEEVVNEMKIEIECTPDDLAALVVALQERHSSGDTKEIADAIAHQLSSFRILESSESKQ